MLMTSVQHPSTKDDILRYLLKQGEATAQALAQHLGVSAQAIRRHLKVLGREQMGSILRKQWERKALEYQQRVGAGNLADRVAKLVQLRQQEGYMAEWHAVEPNGNDPNAAPHYVIAEYNCAISQIAATFPKVCDHELEMFAAALPDCHVTRTHWLVDGEHRCGYLVKVKG